MAEYIASNLCIEARDFADAPFDQRGGLGRVHQRFGVESPVARLSLNEARPPEPLSAGSLMSLSDEHREKVAALCRRSGARRLDVFGSAARGDFDPATSDLLREFDDLPPRAYAGAHFTLKEAP